MKKTYLIIVLHIFSLYCYSQESIPNKVEIIDKRLKDILEDFCSHKKAWARENNVKEKEMILCLSSKDFNDYNIIRLTAIGRKEYIIDKGYNSYLISNGLPVLIKNNLANFFKNDPRFIDNLLVFFKIELFDYVKYLAEKRKNFKLSENDSKAVLGKDEKGNSIKAKDLQPTFISPGDLSSQKTFQYIWEITFYKGKWINTEWIRTSGF